MVNVAAREKRQDSPVITLVAAWTLRTRRPCANEPARSAARRPAWWRFPRAKDGDLVTSRGSACGSAAVAAAAPTSESKARARNHGQLVDSTKNRRAHRATHRASGAVGRRRRRRRECVLHRAGISEGAGMSTMSARVPDASYRRGRVTLEPADSSQ